MRSLKVYYVQDDGSIKMKFGANGLLEQSNGMNFLLEKITKLLFTKTGSNLYATNLGCVIGDKTTLSLSDPLQIELAIHNSIESVQNIILTEQLNQTIPDNQKLDHLQINQIFRNEADPSIWHVEVLVYNKLNQVYYITR